MLTDLHSISFCSFCLQERPRCCDRRLGLVTLFHPCLREELWYSGVPAAATAADDRSLPGAEAAGDGDPTGDPTAWELIGAFERSCCFLHCLHVVEKIRGSAGWLARARRPDGADRSRSTGGARGRIGTAAFIFRTANIKKIPTAFLSPPFFFLRHMLTDCL